MYGNGTPNPQAKIQKISVKHEEYSENQRKHYVKLYFWPKAFFPDANDAR